MIILRQLAEIHQYYFRQPISSFLRMFLTAPFQHLGGKNRFDVCQRNISGLSRLNPGMKDRRHAGVGGFFFFTFSAQTSPVFLC